jgi:hypothetical protein
MFLKVETLTFGKFEVFDGFDVCDFEYGLKTLP